MYDHVFRSQNRLSLQLWKCYVRVFEPLSRKQVSPSHKERRLDDKNASTVVLVTRPAKSFDRPWPVRKTAFRHRLSHLPYSKEKTTTTDLTIETTLKEEESDESRMKKRTTTSLYCPQPKRSTSPFMSLREVNERISRHSSGQSKTIFIFSFRYTHFRKMQRVDPLQSYLFLNQRK